MSSPEKSNFRHLVFDIAWYGIALAATSRFLSMYAIRVGAEPWQLSWLVAIPSLVLLVSSYFGVRWRNRFSGTDRAVMLPAFSQRFVFLLPALTPFLPQHWQPYWLVLAVTLPALPQGVASVVFINLMRESVERGSMSRLFSRRSMAMNMAIAIAAVGFGYMLEKTPFPTNYQIMFVLAYLAAMISLWHVRHVKPLTTSMIRVAEISVQDHSEDQPWRNPRFQRIAAITAITYMAMFSIVPITPLWLVNEHGAAEGFIAMFGLLELAAAATGAAFTASLVKHLGERQVIALGMISTALSTILILIAPSLEFTLISAVLIGGGWATADIALTGYFADNTPVENIGYSRAYFQLVSVGMFVGPLIGGQLAGGVSLLTVMVVGAGLRLMAAAVAMFIALDYDRRTAAFLLGRERI
jgi:MFS family permease